MLTKDLIVDLSIQFPCIRMFFSAFVLHRFRLSDSNQKSKQYKLTNVPKGSKTEIKVLTVFLLSGLDRKIAHYRILFPASNFVPIHTFKSKEKAL